MKSTGVTTGTYLIALIKLISVVLSFFGVNYKDFNRNLKYLTVLVVSVISFPTCYYSFLSLRSSKAVLPAGPNSISHFSFFIKILALGFIVQSLFSLLYDMSETIRNDLFSFVSGMSAIAEIFINAFIASLTFGFSSLCSFFWFSGQFQIPLYSKSFVFWSSFIFFLVWCVVLFLQRFTYHVIAELVGYVALMLIIPSVAGNPSLGQFDWSIYFILCFSATWMVFTAISWFGEKIESSKRSNIATGLVNVIREDIDTIHECSVCGRTFSTNHGLKIHKGRMHK